jgi:hypothetical protein
VLVLLAVDTAGYLGHPVPSAEIKRPAESSDLG